MIKILFSKIFNKRRSNKNTFTIINKSRKIQSSCFYMQNKNERQDSCLSKYFENVKGLNLTERNVYSKIF